MQTPSVSPPAGCTPQLRPSSVLRRHRAAARRRRRPRPLRILRRLQHQRPRRRARGTRRRQAARTAGSKLHRTAAAAGRPQPPRHSTPQAPAAAHMRRAAALMLRLSPGGRSRRCAPSGGSWRSRRPRCASARAARRWKRRCSRARCGRWARGAVLTSIKIPAVRRRCGRGGGESGGGGVAGFELARLLRSLPMPVQPLHNVAGIST